ncbi:MAG TPA: NAD(P)-dependent oxidoreductase [Pseudolabrys sp.]
MTKSRTPSDARPGRMEPLARLPVFLALEGKRAVLAGASQAAAWKAELLSAAGARVDVYADEPSDEMLLVAGDPPRGEIVVHRRGGRPRIYPAPRSPSAPSMTMTAHPHSQMPHAPPAFRSM